MHFGETARLTVRNRGNRSKRGELRHGFERTLHAVRQGESYCSGPVLPVKETSQPTFDLFRRASLAKREFRSERFPHFSSNFRQAAGSNGQLEFASNLICKEVRPRKPRLVRHSSCWGSISIACRR
jgi:hypothetical protein